MTQSTLHQDAIKNKQYDPYGQSQTTSNYQQDRLLSAGYVCHQRGRCLNRCDAV